VAGRVPWALPPALAADEALTRAFDSVVRAGEGAAECHVVCGVGCNDCGIGPFDVAALDAARAAATVEPDPDDVEGRLLAALGGDGTPPDDTIVAAILAVAAGSTA